MHIHESEWEHVCFSRALHDDMVLASNVITLLEKKHLLSCRFDMKDLGEISLVLGIGILRDRFRGILNLSQVAYIDRILNRFNMQNSMPTK
jgi:hypothetical protein